MTVQDYLNLPYNIVIRRINDESGEYYYAAVLELPGCMSDGATGAEAFENIHAAMDGWFETKLANNFAIPKPLATEGASGRFIVRIPKTLHEKLLQEAANEGVSLDQWAQFKLNRPI